MAVERDSFLIPYGTGGQLESSQRRSLTKETKKNPLRYEFSSIIHLNPDEVRQLSHWAGIASSAIAFIGQILEKLPGETTTSLQEDLKKTSSQKTEISSETTESGEIRGFLNLSMIFRSNKTERHKTQTETKEKRIGTQTARTRPGQFLTGGQINDALERVRIARNEGLLLLPAVSSELNRQQESMLSAGRRLVQDYRGNNPDWADDIQEGVISGLIGQLQQVSKALTNGYVPNDIELTSDADQTIKQQLKEDLTSSFQHLVEFSLIPTARMSSVEKAAAVLKKVILEEIFVRDSHEAVCLLDKWREIFAREAKSNSAQVIGMSFGETLAECILQAQNQEDGIFDDLATVTRKTAEEDGAELLLHTFVNVTDRIPFSERSVALYSSFINNLPKEQGRLKEEAIITAIRFFAATDDKEHLDEHVKELLNDLTRFKSQAKLILTADGRKFAWNSLANLIESLGEKRWQAVKSIMKSNDEKWGIFWAFQEDNKGTVPQSLDILIDSEIVDTIRLAFAEIVQNAIEPSEASKSKFDFNEQGLKDLSYMLQQCDKKTQEKLLSHYIGKSIGVSTLMRDYLLAHKINIDRILSDREIVTDAVRREPGGRFGDIARKKGKIDKKMNNLLENIYGEGFLVKSAQQQLITLKDVYFKLSDYEKTLSWKSKSKNLVISINAKRMHKEFSEAFKTDGFLALEKDVFCLSRIGEVFGLEEE